MLPPASNLTVVVLSAIWPDAIEQLRSRYATRVALSPAPPDLQSVLRDAEVAVIRSGVTLNRSVLETASRLKLIVRAGVGLEGIDCDCARERGIRVVSVPLSAESVAEHTLGLILAVSHQIVRQDAALRAGRWEKHTSFGRDLYRRRLGLVGFGRIGQRTAELAAAFGMNISAFDRSPDKPAKREAARRLGVDLVSLEELLAHSDVLAMQVPLNDSTRGLIDAPRLRLMKRDAVLVNVGRGGTVDEAALYVQLRDGGLAGAALDVFKVEPPGASPLLTLPNFVGTPHIAAQTEDAQARVGASVVQIIEAFVAGRDMSEFGVVVV